MNDACGAGNAMNVRVRLYGPAVEWAGAAEATIAADAGETLGRMAGRIADKWPRLGAALGVRLAVNRRYVALDHVLSDGDEVAVLPPMSGG